MLKKILMFITMLYAAMAFAAVDVNTATDAELDSVKGIGPAISKRIVDERKKSNFKDWADLKARVNGFGDKTSAKFSEAGLTVNGISYDGKTATTPAAPASAATKPVAPASKAADKPADKKASAPAVATSAPASAAAKPASAASKPAAAISAPASAASKPAVAASKPASAASKPAVPASKADDKKAAASVPAVAASKPASAASKPAAPASKADDKKAAASAPVAATTTASADEALVKSKGCLACHAVDKKVVGPAYKDVAKKYAGDKKAADALAAKVIKGGSGAWGAVPMPPNNVTEAEAKKMVAWVLSQK